MTKKQHATNPYYQRERRNGEAVLDRLERRRRRMARPLTDAERALLGPGVVGGIATFTITLDLKVGPLIDLAELEAVVRSVVDHSTAREAIAEGLAGAGYPSDDDEETDGYVSLESLRC
jgi:hypothetical protein